ncbi:hypothetical protein MLD38_035569 [Melastoma candidum]|uniref:Uncharacterized protein n=2 Tax=Melastoma candidum TaxID=119954 RepID=A0ACB9LI71_9MYRT|nr:hypothetical protein MLD38_035568 [Melastoma candidum]KAI4310603.1 hypothetical protein MLD38_035569 [Melastoma candidum]
MAVAIVYAPWAESVGTEATTAICLRAWEEQMKVYGLDSLCVESHRAIVKIEVTRLWAVGNHRRSVFVVGVVGGTVRCYIGIVARRWGMGGGVGHHEAGLIVAAFAHPLFLCAGMHL